MSNLDHDTIESSARYSPDCLQRDLPGLARIIRFAALGHVSSRKKRKGSWQRGLRPDLFQPVLADLKT